MTKTVSFPELINDRFAEIAGSVDPQTVLTLKGFTAPEISSICSSAGKLGFEVCVPEVAPLDVNSIENNARAYLMLNLNEVIVLPFEPDLFAVERYEGIFDAAFSN